MKKTQLHFFLGLFLAVIFSSSNLLAQVPKLFNYQGIARDEIGNPLAEKNISLKISILSTSDATVADYCETQLVQTNKFGLYTLQIGAGKILLGNMSTVNWETGNKYIRIGIDPIGGEHFVDAGTTQLLSVPYAIYANNAGLARELAGTKTGPSRGGTVSTDPATLGIENYLSKFTSMPNTITNSQLFDNGVNVGIGTALPSSKLHLYSTIGNVEHLRMENTNSTGFGKFIMYNDNASNYATFTKYGSQYVGGYPGLTTLFPYANLLAFGNNGGGFLMSTAGNVGISQFVNGSSSMKFFADYTTGKIGIGGNNFPATQVHFNNALNGDTIKVTNSITGHLQTDGLDIRMNGASAEIVNIENSTLSLGTNNTKRVHIASNGSVGIGTTNPTTNLDIVGVLRMSGGSPAVGKVLTSDATGLASWQNAPSPTGTLTGFVRLLDPIGNGIFTGLLGINVSIDGSAFSTTTDANGKFTFTNLPQGNYTITSSKLGYGSAKIIGYTFVGGTNTAYIGSLKMSQVPTFNVTSISAANSGGDIVVTGNLSGTSTNKRTIGLFFNSTAGVSSNTASYIAFKDGFCASGTGVFSININAQFIAGLGLVPGNTLYIAAYSINEDNNSASEYTDVNNGRKIFTAIGSAVATTSIIVP